MRISGPYVKDNLSIYLIHGADRVTGAKYLTLQEAMDQKKVVVHETGNVNELAIENLADEDLYIQSGEIVKGGKQDRTIGTDMIITRAMGKTPIASFCVEHGRWQARGRERSDAFASSSGYVAGAAMKRASSRRPAPSLVKVRNGASPSTSCSATSFASYITSRPRPGAASIRSRVSSVWP